MLANLKEKLIGLYRSLTRTAEEQPLHKLALAVGILLWAALLWAAAQGVRTRISPVWPWASARPSRPSTSSATPARARPTQCGCAAKSSAPPDLAADTTCIMPGKPESARGARWPMNRYKISDIKLALLEEEENLPAILREQGVNGQIEMAAAFDAAGFAILGPFVAVTTPHTGRSPNDKFVVEEETTKHEIAWGKVNASMSEEKYERILAKVLAYLEDKPVYVSDSFCGADPKHTLPVRFINQYAWQNLFVKQLFIRPDAEQLKGFKPDFTVIAAPGFLCDPKVDGTNSEACVLLNFKKRVVVIAGSQYAGEIKKSIFSVLNYLLPRQGVLSMHCSANVGTRGDVALFFGLSGTGKTTLSADASRTLIGDDEHGWSDTGVFNFEGGCYAKVIRLSPEGEPEIYQTTRRFGTILENVWIDFESRVGGASEFEQAGRDAANAGARQSSLAQGYTRVTAPYDGWVLQTLSEAGDLAVPGKPLMTLYAPLPLRAVVQVPASRGEAARAASRVEVQLPGADGATQWVNPSSRSVMPAADPVSQTIEWRLELPSNAVRGVVPGQQVRVRFVGGQAERVVVPASAILRRGELTAVYVATASGFALKAVRLGPDHGSAGVEVLAGLVADDRVALDPVRAGLAGARAAGAPAPAAAGSAAR